MCTPSNKLTHFISIHTLITLQGEFEEMKTRYKQLLTYMKDAVTRNKSEKSINSILDYISTSQQVCTGGEDGGLDRMVM